MSGYRSLDGAGIPAVEKGAASGVATLDANIRIPRAQMPWAFLGLPALIRGTTIHRMPGGPLGTFASVPQHGRMHYVFLGSAGTIDRVYISVTTAGDAAAVARVGLYGPWSDEIDHPVNLPKVGETVDIDVTSTGNIETTVSWAITQPGLYAFAVACKGQDAVDPVLRVFNATTHGMLVTAGYGMAAPTVTYAALTQDTWWSGTDLPAAPPVTNGRKPEAPVVWWRWSA